VHPPIVARQRLGKNSTAATNTQATIKLVFYGVRVVSKSRRLVLSRTSRLSCDTKSFHWYSSVFIWIPIFNCSIVSSHVDRFVQLALLTLSNDMILSRVRVRLSTGFWIGYWIRWPHNW
jgi:hypothetical protein